MSLTQSESVIAPESTSNQNPVRSVLVTGGAGYIGSVLVRRLIEAGYSVRVLDSLLFGDSSIKSLRGHGKFELLQADFRHLPSVIKAVQGMDAVVHLGAIVGDPACKLDAQLTLETNLAATAMIRSACQGMGIERFLFASTCSVYGASDHISDERSTPAPISLYACTKVDSERLLLSKRTPDFAPTVLRIATIFGWSPRPRFDLVVNQMTARALREHRVTVFNQTQWRPFVHVDDIARAFIACLEAPASRVAYQVFNVGSSRLNATLGELASRVAAQVPGTEIQYVENTADHRNYRVCFDKIASVLGFDCRHTLEDGIAEIKTAIAEGLVADYLDAKYHNDRTLQRLQVRPVAAVTEEALSESERFLGGVAAAPPFARQEPAYLQWASIGAIHESA